MKLLAATMVFALAACGGAGGASGPGAAPARTAPAPPAAPATPVAAGPAACAPNTTPSSTTPPAGPAPRAAAGLTVPAGFHIEIVGNVPGARELAFTPSGDLLVGTNGSAVYLLPNAAGQAASPHVFADVGDAPAAGVAFSTSNCSVYVGSQFGVYRIPYAYGDQKASSAPVKIAAVRPGGSSDHRTTSVAVAGSTLYASVGSSCNACTETDPTRATIQQMTLDGGGMQPKAVHIRNAIALAVNPATGTLWAGDAGQDSLPQGHPHEFFDGVTLHSGVADYGWPNCEENRIAYVHGANCSGVVVPLVEFPAYQTIVGAAFYPQKISAQYAFPAQYRGGAFVAMHGSWHANRAGVPLAPPRVAFVAMSGDAPHVPVNWNDPTAQWSDFITGFQRAGGTRIGRPTGVAVGPAGGLFVADDQTGNIYRIRP